MVVLDGYEALAADVDDLDGLRLLGAVDRLARDGTRRGIVLALSSSRPSLLPPSIATTTSLLVALGLDDPADYGLLGLRPPPPGSPPGRGRTVKGHELQIGRLDRSPAQVASRHGPITAGRGPAPVAPLPGRVGIGTLTATPGRATVGLRDRDLGVATVELCGDGPFVVTGPPRSGRTTALALLRAQAPDRPVTHHGSDDDPARLRQAIRAWLAQPAPHVFVVDDAERIEDPDGELRSLVSRRHPDALVVVAVRADAWRTGYGSWLAGLRPASSGLALRPDPVHDAESWACRLPSVGPSPPPGRGVLVTDGTAEVVQVAVDDG
jgi:S-DNA-T family DNA segregation ATPase FtsK/SpoIIIE